MSNKRVYVKGDEIVKPFKRLRNAKIKVSQLKQRPALRHDNVQYSSEMEDGTGEETDETFDNKGDLDSYEVEEDNEIDSEREDISAAPVVFQCGTCRSIFGDSFAFSSSNKELQLVTLSAATNIRVAAEKQYSKETGRPDEGSSYLEILCSQCQSILGKQFLTTPSELDSLRHAFSFSSSAIASYELGFPQSKHAKEQNANAKFHAFRMKLSHDELEIRKLQSDLSKVQKVLLVMDERIQALEAEHVDSEEESELRRSNDTKLDESGNLGSR